MRVNNALIAHAAARADVIVEKLSPTLLLGTTLLDIGPETDQGVIVKAAALPWFEILREIEKNPEFLSEFVTSPRKFEEFIAGAYEQAGCAHAELLRDPTHAVSRRPQATRTGDPLGVEGRGASELLTAPTPTAAQVINGCIKSNGTLKIANTCAARETPICTSSV